MGKWMSYGEDRRERDLKALQDPYSWPCYPVMPLKRYAEDGGGLEIGIIKATCQQCRCGLRDAEVR
jgi:hypothetical protein